MKKAKFSNLSYKKTNQTTKKGVIKRNIKYLLIPIGVIWAYSYSWLTDDIFITFRYISNLFAGNGLVYNVGEYVEGFTHPLWVLMLIPFFPNLELAAEILGLLSFAGVIYLLTRSGWLAALLVVLNYEMRTWATGGLETMFFTFLVLFSVWATLEKKNWVGWILLAMVLTRPDGLLIAGIILLFDWRYYKPLLLLIPFLVLRYFYYGDFLPNTYYTKSGGNFLFSIGLYYTWIYVSVYISIFLVLIGFKFIKKREIALPMAVIFGYWIFFILMVGGDFMYGRFLTPIIPLIYFVIEYLLKQFKNSALLVGMCVLVLFEINFRHNLFYDATGKHKPAFELGGITDESWYWHHDLGNGFSLRDMDKMQGCSIRKLLSGDVYVILLRSQCAFAYYLGTGQFCLMSEGLTDKYIARLPSNGTGRVGHEKIAPLSYIKERGVNFLFNRAPLGKYYNIQLNNLRFMITLVDNGIQFQTVMEIITMDEKVKMLFNKN